MISQVEFLSCDHRSTDFSPQGPERTGPPFDEYLVRAEQDRIGAPMQTGTAGMHEDPKADVQEYAEDPDKSEPEETPGLNAGKREGAAPGDPEKVHKAKSGENSDSSLSKNEINSIKKNTSVRNEKINKKDSAVPNREAESRKDVPDESLETDTASGTAEMAMQAVVESRGEKAPAAVSEDTSRETAEGDGENTRAHAAAAFENGSLTANIAGAETVEGRKEEQSRSSQEKPRRTSELRKVNAGDDADRGNTKVELIDLRSRKAGENEQAVSQPVQKTDVGTLQDSLKPEVQSGQDFVVIEAAAGKTDTGNGRVDAGPAKATADLTRALKENGNGEIVKKAQFVLKDREQGEIRLILKPEKLGEVRIRLNLSDNRHIAGRIIVENNSVREVFQENMESLNRAFRESGFQTAGLDVSVGQRESFSGKRREQFVDSLPVERLTRIFDEQVPRAEDLIFGESRVNVYV